MAVATFEELRKKPIPSFEELRAQRISTDELTQFNEFLDTLEDPEKERDHIANTMYFANEHAADPNDVPLIYDSTQEIANERWGKDLSESQIQQKIKEDAPYQPVRRGFLGNIAESWKRGAENIDLDIATYESLFEGKGDYAVVKVARDKLAKKQTLDPIEGILIEQLFYEGANIVPGMAKGYWSAIPEAFAGMVMGAGLGALVGQVPPLTVSPFEDIPLAAAGAVTGTKIGLMTGSATFWYKQGAGAMIHNMLEKGYDLEVSKTIAGIAAIPYAIIEFLQVKALTPGMRVGAQRVIQNTMLRVLAKATKRYGMTLTQEVLEEIAQEIVQIGAEDLAGYFSGHDIKIDAEWLKERSTRVWEVAKAATKGMALLPVPGAAIDIKTGLTTVKPITKEIAPAEAKPAAIEAPKPPTVAPVEPKAPTLMEVALKEEISPEKPTLTIERKEKTIISKEMTYDQWRDEISAIASKSAKERTTTEKALRATFPQEEVRAIDKKYDERINKAMDELSKLGALDRKKDHRRLSDWPKYKQKIITKNEEILDKAYSDSHQEIERFLQQYFKAIKAKPAPAAEVVEKVPEVAELPEVVALPPGLTKAEAEHLGVRPQRALRAGQARGEKIGYKAGELQAQAESRKRIKELRAAQKVTKELQESARELVIKHLPKAEQGKLLTRVVRARTPKVYQDVASAVEKAVERLGHKQAVSRLNKTVKAIKKLYGTRGTFAKRMRPEFRNQVERLLQSFKVPNIKPETVMQKQDLSDLAQQVLDTAADESVAQIEAKKLKETLASQKSRTFALRLLPTESIEQITNELKWLIYENQWAERAIATEKAESLAEVREQLVGEIVPKPKVAKVPKTRTDKIARSITNFFTIQHWNLESVTEAIAGGKRSGWSQYIYDLLNTGVDEQYRKYIQQREKVREVMDRHKITPEIYKKWLSQKHRFIIGREEVEFTDDEMMAIYMHSRNEHNLQAMLKDGLQRGDEKIPVGQDFLDKIIAKVAKEQKAFCEDIGNELMDGINRETINETSLKTEGYEIAGVINYWPANRYIQRRILGKKPRGIMSTIEGMGCLKERVGIGRPVKLSGFFATVYTTNKRAASYYGLAAPLRDVKALLNDDDVINALQDKGYGEHLKAIQEQVKRIEDNSAELDVVEQMISKLIRGMVRSVFSINIKLAPRQQLSTILVAPYIDSKHFAAIKGKASKEVLNQIREDSPQLRQRIEHHRYDRDIGTASLEHEPYEYFTGEASLRDKPLAGLRFHDTNAIADVWRMATAEIKDKHPNLDSKGSRFRQLRKERAEWLIRRTQPTWHVKDRSVLGSTPRPLTKAFTMFMSQREKLVMMLSNATTAYQNGNMSKEDLAKVYGTVAMNVLLITLYDWAFASLLYRERKPLRDFAKRAFMNLFGLVYFGRYLAEALRYGEARLTGEGFKEVSADLPFVRIISHAVESLGTMYAAAGHFLTGERYKSGPRAGKPKWEHELRMSVERALESIAMAEGLPYHGLKQIYIGLESYGLAPKVWTKKEKKRVSLKR